MPLLAHSNRRVACTKSIRQVQTLIHVVHHTSLGCDMALVIHAQISYELTQYRLPLAYLREQSFRDPSPAAVGPRFCQISLLGIGRQGSKPPHETRILTDIFHGRTYNAFAVFWRSVVLLGLHSTRVHACTHDRDRFIDQRSNAVLVVLMLASMALAGVMTYPGLLRHTDRVLYAMNRRSATYLGMTISLRSGPF